MRIRSGIDICKIDRIVNHLKEDNDAFILRCFTSEEINYCNSHKALNKKAESFAGRFATKEACAKALGSGIMTKGIGFTDFEVLKDSNGMPYIKLHGEALKLAEELKMISLSVSITHEDGIACASVAMLTEE